MTVIGVTTGFLIRFESCSTGWIFMPGLNLFSGEIIHPIEELTVVIWSNHHIRTALILGQKGYFYSRQWLSQRFELVKVPRIINFKCSDGEIVYINLCHLSLREHQSRGNKLTGRGWEKTCGMSTWHNIAVTHRNSQQQWLLEQDHAAQNFSRNGYTEELYVNLT